MLSAHVRSSFPRPRLPFFCQIGFNEQLAQTDSLYVSRMPQLYSPHVVFSWGEKPQSDVGRGTGVGFLHCHRTHLMPSEGNGRLFRSAYFHSRLNVYFVSPLNAFDTAGRFIEEISSFDAFTQRLQLQYSAYIFFVVPAKLWQPAVLQLILWKVMFVI